MSDRINQPENQTSNPKGQPRTSILVRLAMIKAAKKKVEKLRQEKQNGTQNNPELQMKKMSKEFINLFLRVKNRVLAKKSKNKIQGKGK